MNSRSITRRLIVAVLLLEFLAAVALVALATFHESSIRFRTFDAKLESRVATLLGAVGEADDSANVKLDMNGIDIPRQDLYLVEDEAGHILGESPNWPTAVIRPPVKDEIFRVKWGERNYRFIRLEGTRTIDPGEQNGGVVHHIYLLYGSPTGGVWEEVVEEVRFYALASLLLLMVTAATMAWFLRRGLAPLRELADEAGRVNTNTWQFRAPESARATRELAPLADALEAALERLRRSFEQQRRFTSDAAHELKTDVAIVKSSLQLLTMRSRSAEQYQQGLAVSLGDCERMEKTVQEMLTLAGTQYAAQQPSPTATCTDLNIALHVTLQRFRSVAELRGMTILLHAEDETYVLLESKEGLLLCSNLLQNAIQHSDAGAEIRIDLKRTEGENVQVVLVIEDDGEGIRPETLPHVFEPFFRGDVSRDRKTGGSGLGLAICRAICEQAGGRIEISSTYGIGTRVQVTLPAAPSQHFIAI